MSGRRSQVAIPGRALSRGVNFPETGGRAARVCLGSRRPRYRAPLADLLGPQVKRKLLGRQRRPPGTSANGHPGTDCRVNVAICDSVRANTIWRRYNGATVTQEDFHTRVPVRSLAVRAWSATWPFFRGRNVASASHGHRAICCLGVHQTGEMGYHRLGGVLDPSGNTYEVDLSGPVW